MFKSLAEKIFHRSPQEDELVKLRQIAERAKQFEQSVIESMNASYDDAKQSYPDSFTNSDSPFK